MAVKSDLGVAGSISSSFSKSASALNRITGPSSVASRTNVTGNSKAKETGAKFGQGLKQLSTGVVSAGNNIHSVAKEFSAIDNQASQQFQANTSPMSKWLS